MSSSLYAKGSPIYPDTTQDFSAAVGKLVTFAAGVPAINASATVPAVGVVLDASKRTAVNVTTYSNSIGIMGGLPAPCRVPASAISATSAAHVAFARVAFARVAFDWRLRKPR